MMSCYFFLIPEPHAGFRIAFNMFDADGNEMVDKREFMVVWVPSSPLLITL